MTVRTDPEEFKRFYKLLMNNAPPLYKPYLFPLVPEGKNPLPKISWRNNWKSGEQAYRLLKEGYNIGIAATLKDPLVIVDVDNVDIVTGIKPTLRVRSRTGGNHNFYFTTDKAGPLRSAKSNIPTDGAGEIRSKWQYVVAAGSYVPVSDDEFLEIPEEIRGNAGKYYVCEELPVADITFEELPEIYKQMVYEKENRIRDQKIREFNVQREIVKNRLDKTDNSKDSALWSLTVNDVFGMRDDPARQFESPFHGSHTGKNTKIDQGCLHCWRDMCRHTALTSLAVLSSGLGYTCRTAGIPHGEKYSYVDFTDRKVVFEIWKTAKNMGLLPENDPIPYKGMVWYAMSKGLITEDRLINGWRLPDVIYKITTLIANKEGLPFGR